MTPALSNSSKGCSSNPAGSAPLLALIKITFHANPQHSALRGTRAWKVISLKGYLQAISPTEGPGRQVGKFPTLHVRETGRCHRGAGTTAINWTSTAIDNSIGVFASQRVPYATCRKSLCQLPKGLVLFSEAVYHMPECFVLPVRVLCASFGSVVPKRIRIDMPWRAVWRV